MRIMQKITKLCEIAGTTTNLLLFGMMMLTVIDVFLRYFFSKPITGSTEYSTYMMIGVGFLGLGLCALNDGHVKVDLIANWYSEKSLLIIDSINYFLVVGISMLIIKENISQFLVAQQLKIKSTITGLQISPLIKIKF